MKRLKPYAPLPNSFSLNPWDANAIDQAICMLAWWQERPRMSIHKWLAPLRRLIVEDGPNPIILY